MIAPNKLNLQSSWPETRWDRVLALRDPATRDAALSDLCVMYRGVILAQCKDWNAQEGEDLTQAFFEWLIKERVFEKASPQRGRLRDFLKKVLRNFLLKRYRTAQAQMRGGKVFHVELDEDLMADSEEEDLGFDRDWAMDIMKRVIDTLKAEVKEAGIKAEVLREMIPSVMLQRDEAFCQNELAARLGRPAGSVRSEVFKIKNRFRELLEREVANTTSGSDVQAEIQYLMQLLLKKA
jgi:RNA polymerase sigma factor (sigma-70 family)